ncbi:hypothetical protein CXB51_001862 [Gossypium anomalum]|uniref:BED-type domain-containing protein n=1 Tax=Gossypium anomalum TaxID=47600 RepID=A0A8J5ZKW8_9ROSI|nr:hypothetical protein CXB51_001862 [Gossypium anomalum]
MPPREEFPTKGLEGAPSNDIGWHFGIPVPNTKGNVICKLCGKVVKGGITRFKEHIAHKTDNVAPCPNVTGKQLEKISNHNMNGIEGKNSDEVLVVGITFMKNGDLLMDQLENIMEKEQVNPSQLYNLIQVSKNVGEGVKLPTSYEVSDVYLESEYQRVRDWVNGLKTHWKELGATLMCDGWTNSLNQMHIINFLVYCSKGITFWKSVDVSSVRIRDAEFYYSLSDSVVEEIGENYIVQIETDNEAAMKAARKELMLKRKHLYWTSCAAHCLDLCLKDIGKKPSVAKVLDGAEKKKANDLIKVYEPLVKVLRLVDGDENPTMGFIYEAIDRAKRAIQQDCQYFIEYEKIIDNKWNFMHSDLHSDGYFLNPQFQFGVEHSENVLIETLESTRSVIERFEPSLDTQVRMVNQLYEKVNPLLDGENASMLPVDTSDNEMDVDQSQQQNLSHSSSSSTPSQSGDGPDGGGLSPIDEDDEHSGDRGEIRSSSRYGGEYEVGTTSGHFCDRSEFDGNLFLEPRRDRSEPRAPSKGRGKKRTSVGSSSGRRSSSSNLGYCDLSTGTQVYQPVPVLEEEEAKWGIELMPPVAVPLVLSHSGTNAGSLISIRDTEQWLSALGVCESLEFEAFPLANFGFDDLECVIVSKSKQAVCKTRPYGGSSVAVWATRAKPSWACGPHKHDTRACVFWARLCGPHGQGQSGRVGPNF